MAKATKKVEEAKEVVKTPKVKKITLAEKAAALRQDLSLVGLLDIVVEIAKKVE